VTKGAPDAGGAILSEKMAKGRIAAKPWRKSSGPLHAGARIGFTEKPRRIPKLPNTAKLAFILRNHVADTINPKSL
jgi:hypothetical protein